MREIGFYYPSYDGTTNIRALIWEPDNLKGGGTQARGILQILHGMAEHIERYRDFAEYCTGQGFIVCGHDQIGHGKSVASKEQWGHMPMNGKEILIEDAHRLRQMMQERYSMPVTSDENKDEGEKDEGERSGREVSVGEENVETSPSSPLPYLMFGHSMGSFVLRLYLARYGEGVAEAIICGTGQPSALLSTSGSLLARLLGATRGIDYHSPMLYNLSVGAYSKQIANAQTPLDWLSTNEANVQKYIAAPDCGFLFDAGGNYSLTALTGSMVKREAIAAVPASLPLLFIAGSEDPVGAKGVAVKKVVQLFKETGHTDVTLILYEGMRHEVLNETGHEKVYSDILNWIDERMPWSSALSAS